MKKGRLIYVSDDFHKKAKAAAALQGKTLINYIDDLGDNIKPIKKDKKSRRMGFLDDFKI